MTNLFLRLLGMSITAGWLVLVIMLLRILLRKGPKWLFPALWSLVEIRLLLPQSLESRLSLVPGEDHVGTAVQAAVSSEAHAAASYMGIVWCAGMVVMLLYEAISYLRLHGKLKTAVRLSGNIYQSEYVKDSFIVGLLTPCIYLPFHMDERNIDSIIVHERAHIKRRDHWLKAIAFLLLSIYWFNPLIWSAYFLMCRDIELACDEYAVKNMDDSQRIAYSQALLSCTANRHRIAAGSLAFGSRDVKKRIRSVLDYRKHGPCTLAAVTVLIALLGACFLTNPKQPEKEDTLLVQYEKETVAGNVLNTDTGDYEEDIYEENDLNQCVENEIVLFEHSIKGIINEAEQFLSQSRNE